MLYSPGATLAAGVDPVLRNVVERTSVLRSGLSGSSVRQIEAVSSAALAMPSCLTTHFAASTRISRQRCARSAQAGAIAISIGKSACRR
jgi:hypothetical protein